MAIQHMDNWTPYGNDQSLLLNGVWADKFLVVLSDPDPVDPSRQALAIANDGGAGYLRYAMQNTATTCGVALRMWLDNLPATDGQYPQPFSFRDATNTIICTIGVDNTGRLKVWSGSLGVGGTLLFTTNTPAVTANGFYHLECKVVISATVGSIQLRVEGVPVINLTNLNLGTQPVGNFQMQQAQVFRRMLIRDFVLWDGASSFNNDFLGACIVYSCTPNADINTNWTTTNANRYSVLDNSPPVTGEYIEAIATPIPPAYLAGLTDLPPDVTSVKCVMTIVKAAKSDGGDGNLQVGLKSGATTGLGLDRPITGAQTYWRDFFATDPNTSAAWAVPAVNAAQLQINRTT